MDGWNLAQLEDFFGIEKMSMIEITSCDGLGVGMLVSSSDRDVTYPKMEGCARI